MKATTSLPSISVVDIGARGGAAEEWARIGACVDFFGCEPDEEECRRLNAGTTTSVSSETYYPYAVAGADEPRTFYETRSPTCSSLLKPNTEEWKRYGEPGSDRNRRGEIVSEGTIETVSLTTLCETEDIDPDVLKLDTQGSELEILSGYADDLPSLLGIETEVEFVELYEDQPLFADVDAFLRDHGFELYGLKRHRWKLNDGETCPAESGGRVVFGDALYINTKVFEADASIDPVAAILVAARYGLFDLARAVAAAHDIDTDMKTLLEEASRATETKTDGLVDRLVDSLPHRHDDRGRIVEFDETYGF